MEEFEIYFESLTKECQAELLEFYGVADWSETGMGNCNAPITILTNYEEE